MNSEVRSTLRRGTVRIPCNFPDFEEWYFSLTISWPTQKITLCKQRTLSHVWTKGKKEFQSVLNFVSVQLEFPEGNLETSISVKALFLFIVLFYYFPTFSMWCCHTVTAFLFLLFETFIVRQLLTLVKCVIFYIVHAFICKTSTFLRTIGNKLCRLIFKSQKIFIFIITGRRTPTDCSWLIIK